MTNLAESSTRILVVEDSVVQAFALKVMLQSRGYQVLVAGNGGEALNLLKSERIALVISDIEMPGGTGHDLALAIKEDPTTAHLPVILLTGMSDTGNILRGLNARADCYLIKPVDTDYLITQVRQLLQTSREAASDLGAVVINWEGKEVSIRADRKHVLNLLLTTCENSVRQNRELTRVQMELSRRNEELKEQTRRLRISDNNFQSVLEHSADGTLVIDQERRVRFSNPAAQRMFGANEVEIRQRPVSFPLQLDQVQEILLDSPGNGRLIVELRVVQTIWEGEGAYLAMLRDITRQKENEEKIREQQARLEQANEQLAALATLDGLTGLKNHRIFRERLEEEFVRAKRYALPLSLILLDIDGFKMFNDSFGHPAGDAVLKQVASILMARTRGTDLVARYGGEEFAILLPSTGRMESSEVAEGLRLGIASAPWHLRPVTASFGIESVNPKVVDAAELVRNADRALYYSKRTGRNRVTHCEQMAEEPGLTEAR